MTTGELVRHGTAGSALLAGVGRHARSHGVTSDARMCHPSRMPSEVGAHTRGHHCCRIRSAIHRVDIDARPW
jgi:hypothetical protein